jgi:site-specific DNA-methyltransferase (adenine-specific)
MPMTPYYDEDGITIYHGDAQDLPLDDETVDCIVTSPPYNLGMKYDGVSDSYTFEEYDRLIASATFEMERTLKPGGRLWLNAMHSMTEFDSIEALRVGDAVKTGRRWNAVELWRQGLLVAGLSYRDTIAWVQNAHDAATAWGSMLSPNAPNLRGRWEPILLMFKDTWDRGRVERNDLTWDDFARWTRNVWEMGTAQRRHHPAPFPEDLPRRCILLSTWPSDLVFDPFMGSGTTLRVAKDLGRRAVGVELSEAYCELAVQRLAQGVLAL